MLCLVKITWFSLFMFQRNIKTAHKKKTARLVRISFLSMALFPEGEEGWEMGRPF
jgi:hypothetical protein